MRRALDGLDKQALMVFLVDGADVAAVDLQVGQPQVRQVADHAETPTKALQAQAEAEFAQAPGELLQCRLFGQLFFTDLQGQPWAERRVLAQ
ncbi:hypothetical protein D3C81_1851880 [compost metagenome]